ncbi:hypothetical protein GCM10020001_025990 [Nonomuraea salmonea]
MAPGTWKLGRPPSGLMGRIEAAVRSPCPAGQRGGVDAALGQHHEQEVGELVVADRSHGDHVVAQLDQIDRGARGRARSGQADLVDQHGVLALGDVIDGPGEDVDDVDADGDDGHSLNRQTSE